eukprot:3437877-Amphidinium_carterae.3
MSWLRDRFLMQQRDQRTAYQRHYQRLYQRPLVQFGECVLWKDPHKQRFKYEAKCGYGIYLGRSMESEDSEEHSVAAKTAGVVRCRTARRRPVEDQFDQQMLLAMQGTPWDAKGKSATPIPMMGGMQATVPPPHQRRRQQRAERRRVGVVSRAPLTDRKQRTRVQHKKLPMAQKRGNKMLRGHNLDQS